MTGKARRDARQGDVEAAGLYQHQPQQRPTATGAPLSVPGASLPRHDEVAHDTHARPALGLWMYTVPRGSGEFRRL
jgi:hypothetical protein